MKKPIYEIYRANNPFIGSKIKIYDIETLANCFLYIDSDKQSFTNEKGQKYEKINSFSICPYNNDLEKFVSYLLQLEGMVGFNNLGFDSQVIQYILENWNKWKYMEGGEIAEIIYAYAQSLIQNQNNLKFGLDYPEFKLTIPQLDLYKVHHFDNRAKVQSLKGLQCNLNWFSVLEMPIDHKTFIEKNQLELVEEYCINDTLSTKELYIRSTGEIDLRKRLKQLYGINCTNWSNSKIGEGLCLKFYCEETGKNPKIVKYERTHRDEIIIKDCIVNTIEFTNPIFQSLKKKFESLIITDTHKSQDIIISHRGLELHYGFGGCHGSLSGLFESNSDWKIIDVDVGSFYPSFATLYKIYAKHLGIEFAEVFKNKIVDVRLKEKEKESKSPGSGDKYIIEGMKEASNSVFGKSNDKYSFLFDSHITMKTTISCQLLITMLYEMITEKLDENNAIGIAANTDGLTFLIKSNKIEEFDKICKAWEVKTGGFQLEKFYYSKYFARDVNNYCAVYENIKENGGKAGKIKLKGCFEIKKPLHKDPSFPIIAIALEKFVAENIPIEKTIRNHNVIWDFLGRKKFKSNMTGIIKWIENGKLCEAETQKKATRYYVAEKGKIFLKRYSSVAGKDKFKEEVIEKGYTVEIVNKIESENIKDYKIDYKYYIKETQKIIDSVLKPTNQLGFGF